ncbi:YIP1 family protein [Roseivivax marinus]|uniref:YIP1 family protein n=1 Tax=Roseivivax marinus TaxID=1379903 RepID=UPI001F040B60|nr:YIP1 family protein [Roseivivax marinus]UMA66181.1 YIP1 family protein [Roseivivax marinus]
MTLNGYLSLAWQSVIAPRDVARMLLSLRLGTEAIACAMALVVVLQSALVGVSVQLAPPDDEALMPLLSQPMVFAGGLAIVMVATIVAMTWSGRGIGGTGRLRDVALLVAWVQGLDVLVQALLIVLAPIAPGLAGIVSLAASAAGIWILINFLAEAHGFEGLGKSALSVLLAVTGLALGIALFLSLSGATVGMTGDV